MADFDNNLRSKLESFNPGVHPTPAEIDRLNAGLDSLAKSRYGLKHLLWSLLILLFLGSQLWLIYSNRILRKELFSTKESISELNTEHLKDRETFEQALAASVERQELLEAQNRQAAFDSSKFISRYLIRNQKNERRYLEEALLKSLHDNLSSQQSAANDKENTEVTPHKKHITAEHKVEPRNTSPRTQRHSLQKASGNKDTVVLREAVLLDSSLFDSLYKEVSALKSNFEKEKVSPPLLKTPLPFAWSASMGIKPGYSNLYLVEGRVVLDAHFVTGIEVNNTWAINAGVKYKMISISEYLDLKTSPLSQLSEVPAEVIATGKELEGRAYGFYIPMDITYTANIGGLSPYLRVGSDINLKTVDDLKIEFGSDEYYFLERESRRLALSNLSVGVGAQSSLSDKWQLQYEAGYLIGNNQIPLVFREKNGVYAQFRLGYQILSR